MKWITASFIFIVVMSFCFVFFIIFNWALYNPDSGIHTILDRYAQDTFSRYYRQWWDGINNNIAFGFGLAGVFCMFVAIICYVASVFESKKNLGEY